MDENKRPNAALINREWYESAAGVLSGRKLADLVLYAVQYVLYGTMPETADNDVRLVFAMVRPALDSDVSKYLERCARNAANARQRAERVAASGSEWERVGANTTTTPTPTPTPTPSLSKETKPEINEEREKWLIYGYFWSIGSAAIRDELQAFWSYYESLGWKNNKGAAIVSKVAAARMWRRQFETRQAPNGADTWYKCAQACSIADYGVWNCFAGAEKQDDNARVRLRCSSQFLADFRAALPTLERSLCAAWRVQGIEWELIS